MRPQEGVGRGGLNAAAPMEFGGKTARSRLWPRGWPHNPQRAISNAGTALNSNSPVRPKATPSSTSLAIRVPGLRFRIVIRLLVVLEDRGTPTGCAAGIGAA